MLGVDLALLLHSYGWSGNTPPNLTFDIIYLLFLAACRCFFHSCTMV
jgi:hypothetical protein